MFRRKKKEEEGQMIDGILHTKNAKEAQKMFQKKRDRAKRRLGIWRWGRVAVLFLWMVALIGQGMWLSDPVLREIYSDDSQPASLLSDIQKYYENLQSFWREFHQPQEEALFIQTAQEVLLRRSQKQEPLVVLPEKEEITAIEEAPGGSQKTAWYSQDAAANNNTDDGSDAPLQEEDIEVVDDQPLKEELLEIRPLYRQWAESHTWEVALYVAVATLLLILDLYVLKIILIFFRRRIKKVKAIIRDTGDATYEPYNLQRDIAVLTHMRELSNIHQLAKWLGASVTINTNLGDFRWGLKRTMALLDEDNKLSSLLEVIRGSLLESRKRKVRKLMKAFDSAGVDVQQPPQFNPRSLSDEGSNIPAPSGGLSDEQLQEIKGPGLWASFINFFRR